MNGRRRRWTRAGAILITLAVCWSFSASSALALLPGETQITFDTDDQTQPDISGSLVVYQDNFGGDWDIWVRSLVTGVETNITPYEGNQTNPAIDGNRVVYLDSADPNHPELWCYDITTGEETLIDSTLETGVTQADISGDRIVFRDRGSTVTCFNLATGAVMSLSQGSSPSAPKIDANRAVYNDAHDGWSGISCYNFSTGIETHVTPAEGYLPILTGDKLVYQTDSGPIGTWARRVGVYDFATGKPRYVTPYDGKDHQLMCAAAGKAIYSDTRDGGLSFYMYDTVSGLESRLSAPATAVMGAASNGTAVVYADDRSGDFDLYLRAIPQPTISLTGPVSLANNARATVTGRVLGDGGAPLAGRTVSLEYWGAMGIDGRYSYETWGTQAKAVTDGSGAFALQTQNLSEAQRFRVTIPGDGTYYVAATSSELTVRPRTVLGTPKASRTLIRNRSARIMGAMRGYRYQPGDVPGTMQCYRLEKGKWRLRRSYVMTMQAPKAKSGERQLSYSAVVRLPAGKWRIRARHEDASHGLTYSSWLNVRIR